MKTNFKDYKVLVSRKIKVPSSIELKMGNIDIIIDVFYGYDGVMSYKKNGISRVSISIPRKFHSPVLINRDIPVITNSGREIRINLFNKSKLSYTLYEKC
ncbi:hypothetical protein [Psychrilyobacter atlanticus]|uniref:hypothetical protein n=1 Tax=Psychrilyobacter atlanticus TaxID=271091 RepID=UPI0003FE1BAE|nr:hypothetical protein [Psychrilyobacter atlanticus]